MEDNELEEMNNAEEDHFKPELILYDYYGNYTLEFIRALMELKYPDYPWLKSDTNITEGWTITFPLIKPRLNDVVKDKDTPNSLFGVLNYIKGNHGYTDEEVIEAYEHERIHDCRPSNTLRSQYELFKKGYAVCKDQVSHIEIHYQDGRLKRVSAKLNK